MRTVGELENHVDSGLIALVPPEHRGHRRHFRGIQRGLHFLTGRRLLERGQREAGRARLEKLLDGDYLSDLARECLAVHDPR